ncbi:hypothetical protein OPT61_g4339 [Boeremia exigua]|uniref:Uncharacterized protein n=1 Tax=Boeremia exigua TaxID=749465 RepID=A0ACC2IEF6_9PLEO|nr:hypothetical protein OPT61_g4339 [Boeremia exigua]
MEDFIQTHLRPVEHCVVCTEPFSATHLPVALDCKHIFGHKCISKWLKSGRGNNVSCPVCRHVLVAEKGPQSAFDAPSIWKRLSELPLQRLHTFVERLWIGIRDLWKRKPNGKFTVSDYLETAIFPALMDSGSQAWTGSQNAFSDAYNLIAASWDSLGRPDRAEGLAIPLVRLTRLLSSAATTLPLYLTDLSRTTSLIWKANACLGLTQENVSWDDIMNAAELGSESHFPLLHLYTALVSQSIAHTSGPQQSLPTRRHEIMNLVVEKCCTKIGRACYTGKPSSAFKESLVFVFQELWKYQHEHSRLSLRGHEGEEAIVRGIWAIAGWPTRRDR